MTGSYRQSGHGCQWYEVMGHRAFTRQELSQKAQAMLAIPAQITKWAIELGLSEGPLVLGNDAKERTLVYPPPYECAERKLAEIAITVNRTEASKRITTRKQRLMGQ